MRIKLNVLFPFNWLAGYLGGKWVLTLLHYSISWGDYTTAALAAFVVWLLFNIKYEITIGE